MVSSGGALGTVRRGLIAIRDGYNRSGYRSEAVGTGRLVWNPRHPVHLRAYYHHVVGLVRSILAELPTPLTVIFDEPGKRPPALARLLDDARGRVVRVGVQYEHTLVRPGGRDADGATPSATPLPEGGGCYLARVVDRAFLESCDLVVDYSLANRAHLERAGGYERLLERMLCLSPVLLPPALEPLPPVPTALTLFSDPAVPRRRRFLDAATARGLPLSNLRGVWRMADLADRYRRAGVLVNLHQTDEHHTLEELRVLPALLCGTLVVSESVPLGAVIPCAEHIVWAEEEGLVDAVAAVLADPAGYRERVLRFEQLVATITACHAAQRQALRAALMALA